MKSEQIRAGKLSGLDGLRAFSISLVLLHHFFFKNIGMFGSAGVGIFFVISGFLITTYLLKEKKNSGNINLTNFYLRRAFRILPLVMLFLLVLLVLNILFHLQITALSFISSIFFFKNLPNPGGHDWYTGHFWSLSVEEQYYVIFPFLLLKLSFKRYKQLLLLLIIVIPVLNVLYYNSIGIFYSNLFIHRLTGSLVIFLSLPTGTILIGSYLACLLVEGNAIFNINKITGHYFFSTTLLILALLIKLYSPLSFLSEPIFALLTGYVIINNTLTENFLSVFLNLKPMAYFGVLSFSLYVWQQIFSLYQPWAQQFKYADSMLLNFAALLVVSVISYHFYEKKFLNFKTRFN